MKKNKQIKFSWCPVCMVHTYYQKEKEAWTCSNKDHQAYLHFRTDPWIEEYRQENKTQNVLVKNQVWNGK